MKVTIFEKDEFQVIGKKISVSCVSNEQFKQIPLFWSECMEDGSYQKIESMSMNQEMGVMGICANFSNDLQQFDYYIAAVNDGNDIPTGMDSLHVPAATWACFEAKGPLPDALQDVWKRIFSEWFPESGYEPIHAPQLELYSPGDITSADYKSYVWIPVVKKN
ncbi:GyrI-like domain-containing protein [Bacillus sp. 03113]|uniref:GyrI-like domain-containing protein n=1 Tax=Bacillus sp. 03113 TaxID=2578211 RepID=UPI0011443CF2|nr:GyrI-like domain-containing protein [Bacillus sp. 03113]